MSDTVPRLGDDPRVYRQTFDVFVEMISSIFLISINHNVLRHFIALLDIELHCYVIVLIKDFISIL